METGYREKNPLLHYGILFLIYGAAVFTLLGFTVLNQNHQHGGMQATANMQPMATAAAICSGAPAHTYHLTFTDKTITPASVTAQRCDELVITNNSGDEVMAALGPHEHHIHYPGFEETPLSHGQSYSFRLVESGTFPLHDHDNDSLRASLVVKN